MIRWRAFPLHPDTPQEGLSLKELFAKYPMDVEKMLARLREKASELGLPFGERKKTYNSRLAQEMGLWAESKGKGELFHKAAFHAYFADGKNIAKIPVVVELAASVGLPEEDAALVLSKRLYKQAVDEDWKLARMMGITAVPTFVIDSDRVVGAQPYKVLSRFVESHGGRRTV